MKTLVLVRHAKSSWDNPGLSDFERKLNKRGVRDAPYMGKVVKEKGIQPDLIVSSPAVRALTTAKFFAHALDYSEDQIDKRESIYTSGPRQILTIINHLDDELNTIMLFGHNPDLTTLFSLFI
jgi:phosphohistidine phosphatase